MIVVIPDAKTAYNGSMYSGSMTTGDFETFVSRDLVRYVDAHYRTIPDRLSRGLAGHSMGGYGTARIGMKHADTFGALYMMSPCCLRPAPPIRSPGSGGRAGQREVAGGSAKLPFRCAPSSRWRRPGLPIRRSRRSLTCPSRTA
jgi:enterochelin esterase-like enzyme